MPSASETYWSHFNVTDKDVERIYASMLEKGDAAPISELARIVITARAHEEQERRARLSSQAVLYQPKLSFEAGQRLIFSALNDAEGTVTAVRTSDNPRLAPFQVVTVSFGDGANREYAGGYDAPHPLNELKPAATGAADESPDEIYAQYGESIAKALAARLRADKEFVEQENKWLLRGLLTDVNVGFLNIAEAAIEQNNTALPTIELARILELDTTGTKRETVLFSLEYALKRDERFVDVGPRGETRWYLNRLVPPEVLVTPRVLNFGAAPVAVETFPAELETLLHEIENESDADITPNGTAPAQVNFILTYPHRRAGSLPLTQNSASLFPEADKPMLVTLVDDNSTRHNAWIVPDGNYIAGLKQWYDQTKLNPGALLELAPREEPLTAKLSYTPQRERSLWVRSAKVQALHLTFGTDRRPVAHKYDEEMLILIGDAAGLDRLTESNYGDRILEALLMDVFPELAKLVPGGRVHAKTLYSAANFARRVGVRAVFGALVNGEAFSSVGGGYFVLQLTPRPA
jgi:hypothetical protein